MIRLIIVVLFFFGGVGALAQSGHHPHRVVDSAYVMFNPPGKGGTGRFGARTIPKFYRIVVGPGAGFPYGVDRGGTVELVETPLNYRLDTTKRQDLQQMKKSAGFQRVESLVKVSLGTSVLHDTLRLRYFPKLTDSLIGLLKKDSTLRGLYIDDLDLDGLIKEDSNKRLMVDVPLRFDHCMIRQIVYPIINDTSGDESDAGFHLLSSKDSVFFKEEVSFSHCSVLSDIEIGNGVFSKRVVFSSIYGGGTFEGLKLSNCSFLGPLVLTQENDFLPVIYQSRWDRTSQIKYVPGVIYADGLWRPMDLRVENGVFQGPVSVLNSSRLMEIRFGKCNFGGRVDLSYCRSSFDNGHRTNYWKSPNDYGDRFADQKPASENNLFFTDCDFNKLLNLEQSSLWVVYLLNCKIRDSLILYGTSIDTSINYPLAQLRLLNKDERNIVIVNPDKFSFENLGIKNYSVKQLYLPYVLADSSVDAEQFYQGYNEFYMGLEQSVATVLVNQPEIKDELTARFEYDRSYYDRVYDRRTWKVPALMMNGVIEATVKHGYHGEINFILSSLIVIWLFAFIYLAREGSEINRFLAVFSNDPAEPGKLAASRKAKLFTGVIWLAQSIWVSFYIFITPKFSTKFFRFKGVLFLILLLEWVIGVFFVILFLIYIASKYSFVKALFGL